VVEVEQRKIMMTEKVHNIKNLRENRKKLRNNLTPAEAKLWSLLKNSQFENKKVRRQHSVGPYVLDFYCPTEKLCIELDGMAHFTDEGYEYDTARTEYLKAMEIRALRFENKDVFENTEGVLVEIRKTFISSNHPLPLGDPSLTKEGS